MQEYQESGSHVARGGAPTAHPHALRLPVLMLWLVTVTAIIVPADLLTDSPMRLTPFLIFLPIFVAGRGTVAQTAFAAAWVVLAVIVARVYQPLPTITTEVTQISFTVLFGVVSILICRARLRREEEIVRLRSAAAALQRQILHPLPLRTREVTVDGLYEPVEEDSRVGGDVYEVTASPYGTRVLIADVQGMGIPAIGMGFSVLGAFREAAYHEPELSGVVEALERAVTRHNGAARGRGEPERFVTALVLNIGWNGETEAVNCGHIPPLALRRGQARPALLKEPDVPLGLDALADKPRTSEWFTLSRDTTLLLCTDGVIEARAPSGEFYPLRERAAGWNSLPPRRVVRRLRADLMRHTGGRIRDDVTALVLRRV